METIGNRAYQAIKERAEQNGRHILDQAEEVFVSKRVLWAWQHGQYDPRAYFLQELAKAGYDVIWILTGKREEDGK